MSENTSCCHFCLPETSYKPGEIDYNTFLCPTACNFWVDGLNYCDEAPQNADCNCCGPPGRDCIVCYTCCAPIGLVIDTITLPFRMIYFMTGKTYNNCKKCCKSNKTSDSDEN
tara:strand:+ start:236 stop:574 length:339 start_codon:yes stop_codon:yes gene_type:complete